MLAVLYTIYRMTLLFRIKALAYIIRQGQLLKLIKYKLKKGYVITKTSATHVLVKVPDQQIMYDLPQGERLKEYLYSIDPLTEVGMQPSFIIDEGVFIDIGAFVGKYSLSLAKMSPAVQVLAIEPNPTSRKILLKNVKLNGLSKRVQVMGVAIAKRQGKKRFVMDGALSKMDANAKKGTVVTAITFEQLLKQANIRYEDVRLIKIDVEGHEHDILRQIARKLPAFKHVRIICEILPGSTAEKDIVFLRTKMRFRRLDEYNVLFESR